MYYKMINTFMQLHMLRSDIFKPNMNWWITASMGLGSFNPSDNLISVIAKRVNGKAMLIKVFHLHEYYSYRV